MKFIRFFVFGLALLISMLGADSPNPYMPILTGSVVSGPSMAGIWRWYVMGDNVYADGTHTPTVNGGEPGTNTLAERIEGDVWNVNIGVGAATGPVFTNAVAGPGTNTFPAITFLGFNTINSGNESYTINAATICLVIRLKPGDGKTYSNVQVYGMNQAPNFDQGIYYTLSGTTNAIWTWRWTVNAYAYITNSVNEWQVITARIAAASGIPEIKDNNNTVIGVTEASGNPTINFNALTGGAETNSIAEVVIYTNRLSDAQLLQTRTYLMNKYFISGTP